VICTRRRRNLPIDTRNGNPDPYVVRISINRTKGTTFDTWRKLRFPVDRLGEEAISGEGADLDCDHIPDLAEYALGLEPNHLDVAPVRAGYHNRYFGWNITAGKILPHLPRLRS
jgi:hypothetical protein